MTNHRLVFTYHPQSHIDTRCKPCRRTALQITFPIYQQRIPHARLGLLRPQQRIHLFPKRAHQEPPQRVGIIKPRPSFLGILRQKLDEQGDRDGDPTVSSGPQRSSKVVSRRGFGRGEFPAVEPEPGDRVHEVLDVKHELVFGWKGRSYMY
jgi:hypothetical protein